MGTDSQGAQRLVAGRYRLIGVLGRGAMGVVWRATDELIRRSVAVKELRLPPGLSEREQSLFAERALREARTAGQLNHPGVVAIYDLVPATPEDDAVYIVMELVEAPSLAELLERNGALAEERVAHMAAQVLGALNAAHSIGLVHRDIKPSNIMMLPGNEVKLVDFGIAHAMDDTRLTHHGIAGSTGYMAPELFQGADPSPATDLWSLGATLFHAVEGHDPFARQTPAATLHAILHDDLPPLSTHPPLSTLINGLLTRNASGRMTSAQADTLLRSATTAATDTTTVRPTIPPPHTPPAPRTRPENSARDTWEDHPTTIRQPTVDVRCEWRPADKKNGKLAIGLSLAIFLVSIFIDGPKTDPLDVAFIAALSTLFWLICAFPMWIRQTSAVKTTTRGLTFEWLKQQWDADWTNLERITLEPAPNWADLGWRIDAELRDGVGHPVHKVFRVNHTTARTLLRFPTQERERTELRRLDAALRDYAHEIYQPHDDLVTLLNS